MDKNAASTPEQVAAVRAQMRKVIKGQDGALTGILVGLLAGGHVLLEGPPGTAKTLMVRTLARACSLTTARIQFTPDLMPADITGSVIYDESTRDFTFRTGPIFAQLVLADEINRTPPKTQSALLEAMAEGSVTVDRTTHSLPQPFCVIATQNPIEHDGTYRLPQAQLDRFSIKLDVSYGTREDEIAIIAAHANGFDGHNIGGTGIEPVMSADVLQSARRGCANVRCDDRVAAYIVDICRATRTSASAAVGVSPRGASMLLRTASVWAWLDGRDFVLPDDVKALAPMTLAHRIIVHPEAAMDNVTGAQVLAGVLAQTPVPA